MCENHASFWYNLRLCFRYNYWKPKHFNLPKMNSASNFDQILNLPVFHFQKYILQWRILRNIIESYDFTFEEHNFNSEYFAFF